MRVLIDANIPLNVWIVENRPQVRESAMVMEAVADGRVDGYMTSSLVLFALSWSKRRLEQEEWRREGQRLLDAVIVIDQPKDLFRQVLKMQPWTDMEDAFQYHTAVYHRRINAIVTTNLKHYANAPRNGIPVMDPKTFLRRHLPRKKR